jgi:PH/SEC7 domain-containing protein
MTLRFKRRGEKALERALQSDAAHGGLAKGKWKGRPHARTITEVEEPSPVIVEPLPTPTPSARHRRERAQVDDGEESDA